MRCPVCKTECGEDDNCPQCNFIMQIPEFLNRNDATIWMENVVLPYRTQYLRKASLSDSGWSELLLRKKEVRDFFEITIPTAKKDSKPVGHTLLVCPHQQLINAFNDLLVSSLRGIQHDKLTPDSTLQEVEGVLVNIQEDDVLVHHGNLLLATEPEAVLCTAMREFCFEISVGKGESAFSIRLTVPHFSYIVCVSRIEEVSPKMRGYFENVFVLDAPC